MPVLSGRSVPIVDSCEPMHVELSHERQEALLFEVVREYSLNKLSFIANYKTVTQLTPPNALVSTLEDKVNFPDEARQPPHFLSS